MAPDTMAATDIQTVVVIGTGVIGSSYTALFLAKGLKVLVSPSKQGGVEKLRAAVAAIWPTLDSSGSSDDNWQSRLEFVDDVMAHLDRVDLVTEHGPEDLAYKTRLFAELDARAPAHVPLVSSTSGFPSSRFVTDCAAHPGRVLVVHPFNPPHLIPAVEVVPQAGTDAAVVDRVMAFYRHVAGQQPVRVRRETPGFVLNRLQAVLLREAQSLVLRGVIAPGDLDDAVTAGIGLRWAASGPFMCYSLSGGGGAAGFRRVMDHIGPRAEAWMRDIDDNRVVMNDEAKEGLVRQVEGMFDQIGGPEAQADRLKARDETLRELVALKKEKGLP